jgi:septation ring formation regulator EzrA
VTSLADQYIEQQEQRIREIVGDYLLPEEDVVYGVARIKNAYTESNETREKFQRELNEVEEQLAEANRKLEAIYDIFDKAGL